MICLIYYCFYWWKQCCGDLSLRPGFICSLFTLFYLCKMISLLTFHSYLERSVGAHQSAGSFPFSSFMCGRLKESPQCRSAVIQDGGLRRMEEKADFYFFYLFNKAWTRVFLHAQQCKQRSSTEQEEVRSLT